MNRLSRFVSSAPLDAAVRAMPMVHTTSVYAARDVIDHMALRPQPDPVYSEDILYLFYGKPGYFPAMKTAASLLFHAPIFFVLKPDAITSARRILPFDSGAFATKRFDPYAHPRMTLADFEIDIDPGHSGGTPFPESAQKLVATFYRNNRDYYYGNVRRDVAIGALDFEARTCFELIASKESSDFDERASIVEVQVSKEVSIANGVLLAVLAPQEVMDDGDIRPKLSSLPDITIMTYAAYRAKPEYYSALAVEKIGTFLEEQRFF